MIALASVLCACGFALLVVPVVVLFAECVAGARRSRSSPSASDGGPSTVVLIPAHDEEPIIRRTLEALRPEVPDFARVVVVADNCTDATANVARGAGVEVVERCDPARRGKGYALHFGLTRLAERPPEVVVILDADCTVSKGAIALLARRAHAEQRPVQADYLLELGPAPTIRSRISAFAFAVRNRVRARGASRLGIPCQLTGTGMAFPFAQLSGLSLANSELVEDMVMGLELAARGFMPSYDADARVVSALPDDRGVALGQRRRWEQGHLTTLFRRGPTLLLRGVRSGSAARIGMALDLMVPPLALLTMLVGLYAAAAAGARLLLGLFWPVYGALGLLALFLVAVGAAWSGEGRALIGLHHLAMVPLYVAWKIPVYVALGLRRGQKSWQRTARVPSAPANPTDAASTTERRATGSGG